MAVRWCERTAKKIFQEIPVYIFIIQAFYCYGHPSATWWTTTNFNNKTRSRTNNNAAALQERFDQCPIEGSTSTPGKDNSIFFRQPGLFHFLSFFKVKSSEWTDIVSCLWQHTQTNITRIQTESEIVQKYSAIE